MNFSSDKPRRKRAKKKKPKTYIPHMQRKSIYDDRPLPWKKNPEHVSLAGWPTEFCRKILFSTLDICYDEYKEVMCNGCSTNMFPNNCWIVEISDKPCECDWRLFTNYQEMYCLHGCDADWEVWDTYCFDCGDKYFAEAEELVFGE